MALLAPQDPKAAAAELRRCVKDLGFKAGLLPSVTNNRTPLYGSHVFHEIYDEAQRLDVPLTIHGGVSQNLGLDRVASFLEAHMLEHPFGLFIQITNMMFQGVFQEFPTLRMAYLEAGAGWVPYWMERLDEHYEYLQPTVPLMKKPPSDYMRSEQVYYSFEPDEHTLKFVMDYVGEDRLVFASDYNHGDSKFPHTVASVTERKDLSDMQLRKLMCDNAARLYNI